MIFAKSLKLLRILVRSSTRQAVFRDIRGLATKDPCIESVLKAGFAWLARAQDCSSSADGGSARHYDLFSGWSSSYPETTGYILNTWIARAKETGDSCLRERIHKAVRWLNSVQLSDGGFPGGTIAENRTIPAVFNTGQIVLGLSDALPFLEMDLTPLKHAADWLLTMQDPDGGWHRSPQPFAPDGAHTYDAHVAWSLMAAATTTGNSAYFDAAIRNILWVLHHQLPNGWFTHCSLWKPDEALTHTIGYALRGVVEAWAATGNDQFRTAALTTAHAILKQQSIDGSIPGCFNPLWQPTVHWSCLTGISQISLCWMRLYELTADHTFLSAAQKANAFVRKTIPMDANLAIHGAVAGSFPIYGRYCRFQYPNWATKFTMDAQMCEKYLRDRSA